MRHKFDQWIQNEKHVDLERILDHYDEYQSKTDFEKFLRAYLLEADLSDFSGRAKKMVMDVEKNSVSYFENKANYAVFVRSILNDNSLPAFNRAYIASELLKHSIYNKEDLILPKQELQDIIYTLFDSYLPTKKGYDDKVNSFYLFNDDKRENERIVLNSKAHERLLVFLKIPGNFEDYLKYLIRSRSIPNTDGEFVFAPFSKAIFKDWGTFKQMIQEHSFSDPKILALKPIILKGIDEYLAGKDRFQLDGQEKDFILNHLRSTGQYNYRDNY